jgi:hypothetical protein
VLRSATPEDSTTLLQGAENPPQEGSGESIPIDTLKRPLAEPGEGVSKKIRLNGPSLKGVALGETSTARETPSAREINPPKGTAHGEATLTTACAPKEAADLAPAFERLPRAMSSTREMSNAQEIDPSKGTVRGEVTLTTIYATKEAAALAPASERPPQTMSSTLETTTTRKTPSAQEIVPSNAPPHTHEAEPSVADHETSRWEPHPPYPPHLPYDHSHPQAMLSAQEVHLPIAPLNGPPIQEAALAPTSEHLPRAMSTTREAHPYYPYPPHPSYMRSHYAYPRLPFGHSYDNFWPAPPDRALPHRYPNGEDGYQDGRGGGGGDDGRREGTRDADHYSLQVEGPAGDERREREDGRHAGLAFYGPQWQPEVLRGPHAYYDGYQYGFDAGPSQTREPSQPPPHDPYHPRFHQGRHPSIPRRHAARRSPMPPYPPNPTSEQENTEDPMDHGSGGTSL